MILKDDQEFILIFNYMFSGICYRVLVIITRHSSLEAHFWSQQHQHIWMARSECVGWDSHSADTKIEIRLAFESMIQ